MRIIKKINIKICLSILILLLAVLPKIFTHQYNDFFQYKIVKTDFEWNKQAVECIKQKIGEEVVIPFWVIKNNHIDIPDTYIHYSYQYSFALIILKNIEFTLVDQFVLFVLGDSDFLPESYFEGYSNFSCSDNLYLIIKE